MMALSKILVPKYFFGNLLSLSTKFSFLTLLLLIFIGLGNLNPSDVPILKKIRCCPYLLMFKESRLANQYCYFSLLMLITELECIEFPSSAINCRLDAIEQEYFDNIHFCILSYQCFWLCFQ